MEQQIQLKPEAPEEGFTLIELWNIIKNNFLWLAITVVFFVLLGYIYTNYLVTPMYKSSIDIIVYIKHEETSGSDSSKAVTAQQVVRNLKEYIKFRDVIEDALGNLESEEEIETGYTWQGIVSRLSSSSIGDATAFKLTYEDKDPHIAQKLVIAIANEFCERVNRDENSLRFATEQISTANEPRLDLHPSSPNKTLNMVISFLIGAIVGVVFVILKEQFSNIYQSEKDVEHTLRAPVIAIVPLVEDMEDDYV